MGRNLWAETFMGRNGPKPSCAEISMGRYLPYLHSLLQPMPNNERHVRTMKF